MDFRKLIFSVVAVTGLSLSAAPSFADPVAPPVKGDTPAKFNRGTPAFTMTVQSKTMMIDGALTQNPDTSILTDGKVKASIDQLFTVTDADETTEGNLELTQNVDLVLAISLGRIPAVVYSKADFHADHIMYARQSAQQNTASGTLTLDFKDCPALAQTPDQGQDKGQGKNQPHVFNARQAPGEGEGQNQNPLLTNPAQACKVVTVSLVLASATPQPKQDQGQNKDQGQDKGQLPQPPAVPTTPVQH